MFPLDDNFVFGDIFFLWLIFFIWPLSQQKKNTHQQTKLLIQRKHLYAYDMTFLCPPPPPQTKKYRILRISLNKWKYRQKRKYLDAYDMTIYMPLTLPHTSNSHLIYSFLFLCWFKKKKTSLLGYFKMVFFKKKRPYYAIFNWSIFIFFFILHRKSHFFLPLWTFRTFWNCENHDFFLKKIGTWYKFLIVILFSRKQKF